MKIGILSETHGHVERTKTACQRLKAEGVEAVFHCGDVGTEAVLIEMAAEFGPDIPVYVILGNVDMWQPGIEDFPDSTGVQVLGRLGEVELAGKQIAMAHGHEPHTFDSVVYSSSYDYVFTGHTHVKEDRMERKTRVINPGAVFRAEENSVAVLDMETDELRFLDLKF